MTKKKGIQIDKDGNVSVPSTCEGSTHVFSPGDSEKCDCGKKSHE